MNEIGEKFYKTFGIEPKQHCTKEGSICAYFECPKCDYYNYIYPPITDRILLELICLISVDYVVKIENSINTQELRTNILKSCIGYELSEMIPKSRKEQFKKQVQSLFTEGNDAD